MTPSMAQHFMTITSVFDPLRPAPTGSPDSMCVAFAAPALDWRD